MSILSWALFCSNPIVDKFSGVLTLVDVVDNIILNKEASASISIVSTWERSDIEKPESSVIQIKIISEGEGDEFVANKTDLNLKDSIKHHIVTGINIGPSVEGIYKIIIQSRGEEGGDSEWDTVNTMNFKVTRNPSSASE